MPEHETRQDDLMTVAAIGSLSFITFILTHEGLGHVGVCTLLGGHSVLYPVSMQDSDLSGWDHQWMVAAGPLMNFVVGGALWFLLARTRGFSSHFRYFLWLTTAFNLFDVAGYLGLSVLTNWGDFAVLLGGANLNWLLRGCLVLLAGLLYYIFMHAVAFVGSAFLGPARGKRLTLTPYLVAGAVACSAAAMSQMGLVNVWAAVGSSFGQGLGLVVIHNSKRYSGRDTTVPLITRSVPWLVGSIIVTVFYIAVIGRGLSLPH